MPLISPLMPEIDLGKYDGTWPCQDGRTTLKWPSVCINGVQNNKVELYVATGSFLVSSYSQLTICYDVTYNIVLAVFYCTCMQESHNGWRIVCN